MVSMAVVLGSEEEYEPVLSGVAASYRFRTRREHKADAMLVQDTA